MNNKKLSWSSLGDIYDQLRELEITLNIIKVQIAKIECIKKFVQIELIESPDIIPDDQEDR